MESGQIAEVITAFATIATVVVAIIELREMKRNEAKAWERQKKRDTLDAYNELQKEVFDRLNEYKYGEIVDICEDKNTSEYYVISGYLASIERYCAGIVNEIYDFDTFYSIAHGYFDSKSKPIVKDEYLNEREVLADAEGGTLYKKLVAIISSKSSNAKEDYFQNIHKVWECMEERSSLI